MAIAGLKGLPITPEFLLPPESAPFAAGGVFLGIGFAEGMQMDLPELCGADFKLSDNIGGSE